MDKPKDEIVMKTLSTDFGVFNLKIISISLLGSDEQLEWKRDSSGLVSKAPKELPTEYAHAFKVVLEGYKENDIGGAVDAHKDLFFTNEKA